MITEEIKFKGHYNIQSLHSRTIEITKDKNLTLNGDCIVGVNANKACKDLNQCLRDRIKNNESVVEIELIVEPYNFLITGRGNENLSLSHSHDIVLRKSKFICNRTLSIGCDYSSLEVPRKIIELLKDPYKDGTMIIRIE